MPLTRAHIDQALQEARVYGIDPHRQSKKWDLIDPETDARLPPKVILWRAYELAGDPSRPGGGWPTNDVLERYGLEVCRKESVKFEVAEAELAKVPADVLRRMVLRHSERSPRRIERAVSRIERSPAISAYAKQLAAGRCDLCEQDAPFSTSEGPFLECHHIIWLSEGGADHIDNVVALCPNCHRKMHYVALADDRATLWRLAKERARKVV